MRIRRDILSRVRKAQDRHPEFKVPFVKGGFEWITNTYFLVRKLAEPGQRDTEGKFPEMDLTVKQVDTGKQEPICFNIEYLIDALVIMKDNGVKYVDVNVGRHGARLESTLNVNGKPAVLGLVMAKIK